MCVEDALIIQSDKRKSYQEMVSTAGSIAIKQAQEAGLPLVFVDGNQIVEESPNGKRVVLGTVRSGPVVSSGVIHLTNVSKK